MKKIIDHLFQRTLLMFFSFGVLSNLPLSAKMATNPIRVACVGDSITYGYGIKNRDHDSYPADLSRLLGPRWDVHNFGVSGTTILTKADLPYVRQKEYREALAFRPNVVIIMFGANDSKHRGDGSLDSANAPNNWQYKADFVPDYEALIAEFRRANPRARIYVCLPTPCFPGRWGINNKTIQDEIIPMVREIARQSRAKIINLNEVLSGKKDLFPDTVHPNAVGAKLMAGTIYQAITGKKQTENL